MARPPTPPKHPLACGERKGLQRVHLLPLVAFWHVRLAGHAPAQQAAPGRGITLPAHRSVDPPPRGVDRCPRVCARGAGTLQVHRELLQPREEVARARAVRASDKSGRLEQSAQRANAEVPPPPAHSLNYVSGPAAAPSGAQVKGRQALQEGRDVKECSEARVFARARRRRRGCGSLGLGAVQRIQLLHLRIAQVKAEHVQVCVQPFLLGGARDDRLVGARGVRANAARAGGRPATRAHEEGSRPSLDCAPHPSPSPPASPAHAAVPTAAPPAPASCRGGLPAPPPASAPPPGCAPAPAPATARPGCCSPER